MSTDGKMTDSGANCCMTNNWKLLEEIVKLDHPTKIGMAAGRDMEDISFTLCMHVGKLPIYSDDGDVVRVECVYNPHASDTIISHHKLLLMVLQTLILGCRLAVRKAKQDCSGSLATAAIIDHDLKTTEWAILLQCTQV